MTRDTLTQIKGTSLEDLFSWRRDKQLPRDGDGRVFLDVNSKCFGVVVDKLNDIKITPPEFPPKMLHLGEEEDTVLQQLLLEFGLRDYVIVQSKRLIGKPKLGQDYDDSDENTKSSYEKCKVMKFDHLPKEKPEIVVLLFK